MKNIYSFLCKSFVLTAIVLLASCSKGDDDNTGGSGGGETPQPGTPDYASLIVGEWFVNQDTGSSFTSGFTLFNSDGTFSSSMIQASLDASDYSSWSGTYNVTGNIFTQEYISAIDGRYVSGTYEIKRITKYDMELYYTALGMYEQSHKIVDTYQMKVGETKDVKINDPDFTPITYSSYDKKVATVSTSGTITAVKRGVSYIQVSSSLGIAVVRVVVTDPDNFLDDMVPYLGEDIAVASAIYGTAYVEQDQGDGRIMRHYFLVDELMRQVGFYYDTSSKLVSSIIVAFRNSVEISKIKASFDKKYEFLGNADDGDEVYTTTKNDVIVYIRINHDLGTVMYWLDEYNPYQDMDEALKNISTYLATDVARIWGYTITEKDFGRGYYFLDFGNSIYDNIAIMFNKETYVIEYIWAFAKAGVTRSDVEKWYQQNYIKTSSDYYPYYDSVNNIYIHIDESDGYVEVVYAFANNIK